MSEIQKLRSIVPALKRGFSFGIELECMVNYDKRNALYSFLQTKNVDYGSDGSIHTEPNYTGVEIKFFITDETTLDNALKNIRACYDRFGIIVNTSCGLHVHVGLYNSSESLEKKRVKLNALAWGILANGYMDFEKAIFNSFPSRQNNSYCQSAQYMVTNLAPHRERYNSLNLHSISSHTTLEFRLFAAQKTSEGVIDTLRLVAALVLEPDRAWKELIPEYFPKRCFWRDMPKREKSMKKPANMLAQFFAYKTYKKYSVRNNSDTEITRQARIAILRQFFQYSFTLYLVSREPDSNYGELFFSAFDEINRMFIRLTVTVNPDNRNFSQSKIVFYLQIGEQTYTYEIRVKSELGSQFLDAMQAIKS